MADNTAAARKAVDGHRNHIRTHIDKHQRYSLPEQKRTMVKQIENAQGQIEKLRRKHPSLTSSWEDTWKPAR